MSKDELKQINVADCRFEWQFVDGSPCADTIQATIDQKDYYGVILHEGKPIYREHRQFCHIFTAWWILRSGKEGKWKTADVLVTLRQALRERYAQCMPLSLPRKGAGRCALLAWLNQARERDTVHHGSATF